MGLMIQQVGDGVAVRSLLTIRERLGGELAEIDAAITELRKFQEERLREMAASETLTG